MKRRRSAHFVGEFLWDPIFYHEIYGVKGCTLRNGKRIKDKGIDLMSFGKSARRGEMWLVEEDHAPRNKRKSRTKWEGGDEIRWTRKDIWYPIDKDLRNPINFWSVFTYTKNAIIFHTTQFVPSYPMIDKVSGILGNFWEFAQIIRQTMCVKHQLMLFLRIHFAQTAESRSF